MHTHNVIAHQEEMDKHIAAYQQHWPWHVVSQAAKCAHQTAACVIVQRRSRL